MVAKVENSWGVEIFFNAAVELMDDDIREELQSEISPCSDQEFFDEYCLVHEERFGEPFVLDTPHPQY